MIEERLLQYMSRNWSSHHQKHLTPSRLFSHHRRRHRFFSPTFTVPGMSLPVLAYHVPLCRMCYVVLRIVHDIIFSSPLSGHLEQD